MSQGDDLTASDSAEFLSTVEGEISFFRSIMRARPVGIHRHFHLLSIRSWIFKDTGHLVNIEDIRDKLQSCYNMDALEALDLEGYDSPDSRDSAPPSVPSPSPSQNLAAHPHFRSEFALPSDDPFYTTLISKRRMHTSASPPSSSPAPITKRRGRRKTKVEMAGLVGGDSDSSALTLESGDEATGEDQTPSAAAASDTGSEDADGVDEETARSHSSVPSPTVGKTTRGKAAKTAPKKKGPATRTRATTSRPTKKRKRGG